jgi:hypothetical protein
MSETLPRRKYPEREGTRSPIFLFQTHYWRVHAEPFGYHYDYESMEMVNDETGERFEVTQAWAYEHCDDYEEWWITEHVWFTREEAERWGRDHEYRFGENKWRVFCVWTQGKLATILDALTDREPVEASQ